MLHPSDPIRGKSLLEFERQLIQEQQEIAKRLNQQKNLHPSERKEEL